MTALILWHCSVWHSLLNLRSIIPHCLWLLYSFNNPTLFNPTSFNSTLFTAVSIWYTFYNYCASHDTRDISYKIVSGSLQLLVQERDDFHLYTLHYDNGDWHAIHQHHSSTCCILEHIWVCERDGCICHPVYCKHLLKDRGFSPYQKQGSRLPRQFGDTCCWFSQSFPRDWTIKGRCQT